MKKNIKTLILAGITIATMGTSAFAGSNVSEEVVGQIQYEEVVVSQPVVKKAVKPQVMTTQKAQKIGNNIFLAKNEEQFLDAIINIDKEKAAYIYATQDMSAAVKKYAPIVESSTAGFVASFNKKINGKFAYYIGPKHYNSQRNFNRAEFAQNDKVIEQWVNNSGARFKATDMEKIKAFATYVKNNSCYDMGSNWAAASDIYSVTRNRKAKCYGFASIAHRGMLKLGIKNYATMTVGNTHIANRALVDGQWKTIDFTPFNTRILTNYYNMGNVDILSLESREQIKVNTALENRLVNTDIRIFDKALGL